MTHEEIIAMAREEGLSFVPDANSPLVRIVRKAVAKERERLFGAGRHLDGKTRLQLARWEHGECFASAAIFTAEQTQCGPNDLLPRTVDRMDDELESLIAAAIRARGQKEGA